MSQFPDKPLIPTPVVIVLIVALLAIKWTFWPDDELELMEDEPAMAQPVMQPMLHPGALEAALAAANHWPARPVTLLVVPCDPPPRPMLIGTNVQTQANSSTQYCVVELDTE